MKLKKLTLVSILALLPSCNSSASQAGDVIVFHDRTSPKYEWLVVIGPHETFLQIADFPGYANRKWYVLSDCPRADKSSTMSGNLNKPFAPGGPNLIRTVLNEAGEVQKEGYFSDDTPAIRRLLTSLESIAEKDPLQRDLPAWLTARKFLLPLVGEKPQGSQ